jgi:hypothetical protein
LCGTLAAEQAQARGVGQWPCAGRKSRPLRAATAGWRSLNATAVQFVGSIHCAAIARDARFTGKSGVGIRATLSTGINQGGCRRDPIPRAIQPIQPRTVRDP